MSRVNDLASLAGIPAGTTELAVAMYGACAAAEKVARPEALSDIGRLLKDPSWSRSEGPSAIIRGVFNWTFGEKHLSWKCVLRSVAATILFVVAIGAVYLGGAKVWLHNFVDVRFAVTALLASLIPGYVALGKTRLLLGVPRRVPGFAQVVVVLFVDVAGSCIISFLCMVVIALGYNLYTSVALNDWLSYSAGNLGGISDMVRDGVGMFFHSHIGPLLHTPVADDVLVSPNVGVYFCSTLFTSVWSILILVSASALKFLAPIDRFTAWFFDVEKHPVQAVGIVAGALVMAGGSIWSVARAMV
jgi:hypothetical protein